MIRCVSLKPSCKCVALKCQHISTDLEYNLSFIRRFYPKRLTKYTHIEQLAVGCLAQEHWNTLVGPWNWTTGSVALGKLSYQLYCICKGSFKQRCITEVFFPSGSAPTKSDQLTARLCQQLHSTGTDDNEHEHSCIPGDGNSLHQIWWPAGANPNHHRYTWYFHYFCSSFCFAKQNDLILNSPSTECWDCNLCRWLH